MGVNGRDPSGLDALFLKMFFIETKNGDIYPYHMTASFMEKELFSSNKFIDIPGWIDSPELYDEETCPKQLYDNLFLVLGEGHNKKVVTINELKKMAKSGGASTSDKWRKMIKAIPNKSANGGAEAWTKAVDMMNHGIFDTGMTKRMKQQYGPYLTAVNRDKNSDRFDFVADMVFWNNLNFVTAGLGTAGSALGQSGKAVKLLSYSQEIKESALLVKDSIAHALDHKLNSKPKSYSNNMNDFIKQLMKNKNYSKVRKSSKYGYDGVEAMYKIYTDYLF